MDENQVEIVLTRYRKFKQSLTQIELRLEEIAVKKYKLPGSIIKKPEGNPVSRDSRLFDLMDKEKLLITDYRITKYYIDLVSDFLLKMPEPDRSMIVDRYINGKSWTSLERKYYLCSRQMSRIIKKRIKEYVSKQADV